METDSKMMTIKEWDEEDRPREKMCRLGARELTDAELLAILIRTGTKRYTAMDLARKMLAEAGGFNGLGKYSVEEFCQKASGIGPAKAVTILAALEIGKRRALTELPDRIKVGSSRDIYSYFQPLLADLPYEEFWILLLNQSHKIIDSVCISRGGITETTADVRLILKYALEKFSTSMALVHNHPSGNTSPSLADDKLTDRVKSAAQLMGIQVLDHLIVCERSYYSYADHGRI